MNTEHDPYESTSWRRAAVAIGVIVLATAVLTGVALLLGLEPQF